MATKKAATKRGELARSTKKKWSGRVTKHSKALDLEREVFKKKDPKKMHDH